MIVVTTEDVAGQRVVETKGQVFGVVVRSRGLGGNIAAGLRSLMGGEIHEYTSMVEDARRQAIDRMSENAALMGANAVTRMMFDSTVESVMRTTPPGDPSGYPWGAAVRSPKAQRVAARGA
jgi:uncharacterized protein YbjQ (UPF0145 family)